ncbi:MAG: CBS domain-containing protein [Candidatus Omnitrophica bacterium]|nr:CBS domain-containing protein [Candidatus Omnitrophota bacterium]
MLKISLEDIMCEHPITVKEDVSVGEVAHLLLRYRINGILIVKKDDKNKLIGIFTTADLLNLIDKVFSKGVRRADAFKKISKQLVGKLASKRIVSFQKGVKLVKAIAVMHKKNVHTIPVFDKDKLVGVVGKHDLINATFHYW